MKKRKRLYVFAALICILGIFIVEGKSGLKQNNIIAKNETTSTTEENTKEDTNSSLEKIDVNLTELSSTMVYSEVYNMVVSPDDYVGKVVKMNGTFDVYEDQETGQVYYACIIKDATACCAQGIEFILDENLTYPDDYPEIGTDITIIGTFNTYEEDGNTYCRLTNAKII